ncbi:ammecr1 [Anaeramoeba flamelloides]|uniref:Ammecr1 n=1 Tax=Anaeramoeba flamelloides TaxID=1746091 RepID=A0AAV8A2M6_9EUKA|nr:ammecr1 [Anaeramoeba flamelloides]KAJ6245590.1 ammecr1 [Anaeramoeba flamelloides]
MTELKATKEMCYYCFDSIVSHFEKRSPFKILLQGVKAPLFVTWKIKKNNDYTLRGCIGTFSKQPLETGLKEFAKISAFRDSRFMPVERSEIPNMRCFVSLLTNFENAENYLDWEPGLHGITIQFRGYRGTFLPEVASDHFNNDKELTIKNLVRKAGFTGSINKNLKNEIKVERYQSSKIDCTYQEYLDYIKKN